MVVGIVIVSELVLGEGGGGLPAITCPRCSLPPEASTGDVISKRRS